MRIIKLLFSHFIIVGLSIILQFLLLILFTVKLEEKYIFFNIAITVLSFLIALKVLNRNINPDYKAPWLVLLIGVPVVGVLVYLFFSRNYLPKKKQEEIKKLRKESQKYLLVTNEEDLVNKEKLNEYYGHNKYLENTSGTKAFYGNKVTYYPFGKDFYEDLLSDLKKAQKYIFMEYFIIENGVMFDSILEVLKTKVDEGVEVRLIYDDVGCSSKLPFNYDKKIRKLGIDCYAFNKIIPIVSGIHNNRNHRKITVIDGIIGYNGGINLADEYIGAKEVFGKWKDTAVRIEGEGVKTLTLTFLNDFNIIKYQDVSYGKYLNVDYPKFQEKGMVNFFIDGPSPMDNELIGENVYLNIINSAKEYVYITTPYFIVDFNILSALKNAAYRGVDVRIITPGIPDKKLIFDISRSYFKELIDIGVKIYEYTPGFIHAKNFVSDDKVAVCGTINLDYRSLVHHFECATFMVDLKAVEDIKEDFIKTLEECKELDSSFSQKFLTRLVVYILKFFTPLL